MGGDNIGAYRLALRPHPSCTLSSHLRSPGSSHPCRPCLEPSHARLHPRQEEAAQAAVQGEQGLGASLGPMLLQLPPARLPQQDLGAKGRAQGSRGSPCPSPGAWSSSLPAGQPCGEPRTPATHAHTPSPHHPERPPNPDLVPEHASRFPATPASLHTYTHLGGSEVTEGRLSPQHLAQDGATPLPVRGLSLPLCPQGLEPAPRMES